MNNWLLANYVWCRFLVFVLIFASLALWESRHNWRPWLQSRWQRWLCHFSLSFVSKLCIRLLPPAFLVFFAIKAEESQIGFLFASPLPYWLQTVFGIIVMDFTIYMQHRFMHKYEWLWIFHRVHHVDRHLDVSTGIRFHPIEELFSMAIKIFAIAFFGVNALSVFIFEIMLNAASLFTHVNVRLRPKTEKMLRLIIVTPGMHRIHHSDIPRETNSNYGFCLSWWDKLFNSYTKVNIGTERKLSIGLEEYRDPKYQRLTNLLLLPFGVKALKVRPVKFPKTKRDNYIPLPETNKKRRRRRLLRTRDLT